jgi:hypothetical protein
MTTPEQEEIQRHMQSLDDRALLRLVSVEAGDYRPEALDIARSELRRRKLDTIGREEFWTQYPQDRIQGDGFCASCRSQTTDESPGNTQTVNFVFGTRLIGHDDVCPVCGSVEQMLWIMLIIPLVPCGKFRVLYQNKDMRSTRYISRKVRQT